MNEDITLQCQDPMHAENTQGAPTEFPFTADEQAFYQEKGFDQPRRCPACRAAKKARFDSRGGGHREMHDAVCASCGRDTQVPFEPRGDKPVYCDDCYRQMKQSSTA